MIRAFQTSRWILAAMLLAGAGGCAVDQNKEVATYRKVLDEQGPHFSPTTAPIAADAPITLPWALLAANQYNEQIALSGENYLQALINEDLAVSAFLPTVSFAPEYTVAEKPPGAGSTALESGVLSGGFHVEGDTLRQFQAPVNGQINLFNGFGDVANRRSAKATTEQKRQLLLDMQQTVLLDVAQVYVQILRSQRLVQVLENSLSVQDARVADLHARLKSGLARSLDVAQSEAQAAATHDELLQARRDVKNARFLLANLVGVPTIAGPLAEPQPLPEQLADPAVYEKIAMAHRMDLLAARSAVLAARAQVDVAVSKYYPSLTLEVTDFLYREDFAASSKWDGILAVNLPIFTAGVIESDVRLAWSQYRQAVLSESQLRRQVLDDVDTAYENLRTSTERLVELKEELRAANEAFLQADRSFNAGLATNLERLTAQDQLLTAQLDLASEEYNQIVYNLNLTRVAGRLDLRELAQTSPASPTTRPAVAVPTAQASGRMLNGSVFSER